MYKIRLNKDYENFQEFVINIKSYFQNNKQTIHKARNELKIIEYNDIDTVVKSFKVPNVLRRVFYTYFRDSKAKKSFDYSIKIKSFTPKPIGYIEFYENNLLHESYFISEKFEYDFTIREPLLDDNFKDKEKILRSFAKFTYELHQNNIFHNDYSPGNILIKKDENAFTFKIVDINRMKFEELDFQQRAKSFSKLWARDDELEIIANEYLKYYTADHNFVQRVCYYSNKNKRMKNLKKRLKGQKVVD